MIARLARVFLGVVLGGALAACQPAPPKGPAPLAPVSPDTGISSDWRVPGEDYASAPPVPPVSPQVPSSPALLGAEAAPTISLPNTGIWADNTPQQAAALFRGIPRELGLKYVYGKGRDKLVIFSDPHNQDDRRLMGLLALNAKKLNATIYVFPLPSAPPVGNVTRILCTQNPEAAWKSWMSSVAPAVEDLRAIYTPRITPEQEASKWGIWRARFPEVPNCQGPARAARIDDLASQLGVVYTPTVIFEHGRAWPGPVLDMSDLEQTWWYLRNHAPALE